jgi:DNA-binding protein HU-beta
LPSGVVNFVVLHRNILLNATGHPLGNVIKKTRSSHVTQKPMTKTQLVAELSDATGSDKKSSSEFLDALAAVITKEVAAGGSVNLPGLGKFACRARPERMVRNPATGEQMSKPADRVAKVTIAKALKDVINA